MADLLRDHGSPPGLRRDDAVTLERVELSDDEDDNFDYGGIPAEEFEEDAADDLNDEDLETALRTLNAKPGSGAREHKASDGAVAGVKPSVIDDFVRNFLIKVGMHRTLDVFNTEWYELQSAGKLSDQTMGAVPDVYQRNQELEKQVRAQAEELEKVRAVAQKAQGTWDKFRKERDFHRMHHQRVVVEKQRLVADIKRLKKHFSAYEPTLRELQAKYESAMKEKMLARLEKDRLQARLSSLEGTLQSMQEQGSSGAGGAGEDDLTSAGGAAVQPSRRGGTRAGAGRAGATGLGPSTGARSGGVGGVRNTTIRAPGAAGTTGAHPRDSRLPAAEHENPLASRSFARLGVESLSMRQTLRGHTQAVSCVALHPTKPVLATGSDDATWKLWTAPAGELIMSGEGHEDWIGGLAFHPAGKMLATASGDGKVKVWDLLSAKCTATLEEHTQAVWGVAFHHQGDFLVSASMDHSCKVWDMGSLRCRQTLRGHVDSVNALCFQPFTNYVCTGSGDKTVSIWDMRTGLCVQTLYGHKNAVNHVAFSTKGDSIASCDADGVVRVWDVRMVAERIAIAASPRAVNQVAFDMSGEVLLAACDDGSMKAYSTLQHAGGSDEDSVLGKLLAQLSGHEDAVQCLAVDQANGLVVSGSSDCTFRIWA